LTTARRRPAKRLGVRQRPLPLAVNDVQSDRRDLGLYRTTIDDLGECAIVDPDAGDGAPFLSRDVYEALGFLPHFDALPLIEDVAALGLLVEHRDDDPMIG
jgi:hypothetical protein